jgi:hypothetical protein
LSGNGKLVPYIYSYGEAEKEVRFLVEVASTAVRVLSPSTGSVVALFQSGDDGVGSFEYEPSRVRWKQLNKLLFLVCDTCMPRVLEWDGNNWKFYEWSFRHMPYRYNHEERDWPLVMEVKYDSAAANNKRLEVSFEKVEGSNELPSAVSSDETLRLSYWVDTQEVNAYFGDMTAVHLAWTSADNILMKHDGSDLAYPAMGPTAEYTDRITGCVAKSQKAYAGRTYACISGEYSRMSGGHMEKNYACIKDFATTDLVTGLYHPDNYTANFVEASCQGGITATPYPEVITTLRGITSTIKKNQIISLARVEMELWHCIKTPPEDELVMVRNSPEYFRRGLPMGRVRCKGPWSFYCSGVWFGEYEVFVNYSDNPDEGEWESRGKSSSGPFTAGNNIISGDESDEECWLELRLMTFYAEKSDHSFVYEEFYFPESNTTEAICANTHNRLIVDPYKRDIECVVKKNGDGTYEVEYGGELPESGTKVEILDWSWAAFGKRYGFPRHVCEFNSRLVFASTVAQPQTVWMSKVDDINNFSPGSFDDSSIWLTLNTPSQNAICWIGEKNYQLIAGTAFAEVGLTNPNKTVLTSSNAVCVKHGYVGSIEVPALVTANNILYVGRGGWRVYQFGYSLESDSLVSTDISVFASHIGEEHGGFICAAMADKPDPVAYFVMGDGSVALCTYNGMQQVRAWHRWTTDGEVKDVCVLPDGKNRDRVFFLVVRDGLPVIGVMDDASPFRDWGSHDYHSRVVTTALGNVLQSGVRQQNAPKVRICWGQDFVYDGTNMWVSKDGFTTQYRPADYEGAVFKKGWREVLGGMEWGYEVKVGVDVCGDNACNILAIQG